MTSGGVLKVLFRLLILIALSAGVWFFASRPADTQQVQLGRRSLPVQTEQLEAVAGVVPIRLQCEDAELSSPNAIEKLSCVLKNNTNKYITAGSVNVSVVLDSDGKISEIAGFLTFDTFVHPDFREEHANNLVSPGTEYRLQDSPTTYDRVIKAITTSVDYVEFSDGTTTGPNNSGSRIIADLREGALKYKKWLTERYNRNGRSIGAIVPLLSHSESLMPELVIDNADQELGAKIYRSHARRTYETKGAEGLAKQLNAVGNPRNK